MENTEELPQVYKKLTIPIFRKGLKAKSKNGILHFTTPTTDPWQYAPEDESP